MAGGQGDTAGASSPREVPAGRCVPVIRSVGASPPPQLRPFSHNGSPYAWGGYVPPSQPTVLLSDGGEPTTDQRPGKGQDSDRQGPDDADYGPGPVLRGNFTVKRPVVPDLPRSSREELEETFEKEATSKLAGSIAFVTRKGFLWKGESKDGKGGKGGKDGSAKE